MPLINILLALSYHRWFLQNGTLAPEFSEGGTLPPHLMGNGTFAPGLVQDGEIDLESIQEDWLSDLLPAMADFDLSSKVLATPVYRAEPFFEYKRVRPSD